LCNHCCRGKTVSITYSECVLVVLVIQDAMRLRHIAKYGLSVSAIFSTLCQKRYDFLKKMLCVFRFPLRLVDTFLILRRTERKCDQKCILVFMQGTRCSKLESVYSYQVQIQITAGKGYLSKHDVKTSKLLLSLLV